jgi:hypothetical protein
LKPVLLKSNERLLAATTRQDDGLNCYKLAIEIEPRNIHK